MKLIVTLSEIKNSFAEKHNLSMFDVEIAPEANPVYAYPGTNATPESRLRDMATAVREAKVHNKIGAIKAFRSATGCGLKEAKDFVEAYFCPPPF